MKPGRKYQMSLPDAPNASILSSKQNACASLIEVGASAIAGPSAELSNHCEVNSKLIVNQFIAKILEELP